MLRKYVRDLPVIKIWVTCIFIQREEKKLENVVYLYAFMLISVLVK